MKITGTTCGAIIFLGKALSCASKTGCTKNGGIRQLPNKTIAQTLCSHKMQYKISSDWKWLHLCQPMVGRGWAMYTESYISVFPRHQMAWITSLSCWVVDNALYKVQFTTTNPDQSLPKLKGCQLQDKTPTLVCKHCGDKCDIHEPHRPPLR